MHASLHLRLTDSARLTSFVGSTGQPDPPNSTASLDRNSAVADWDRSTTPTGIAAAMLGRIVAGSTADF